jgi:hypothetical protein
MPYCLDQISAAGICSKGYHDPFEDAAASMELYKRYVEYGDKDTAFELFQARQTLARYGSFVRVRYCLQF